MRIDEQLNLVLPVERENGQTVWVHAAPISRETFQQHYLVLAKVYSGIFNEGLHITSGPQIAAIMLRDVAQRMNVWEGPGGVEQSLLGEIKRLANVVIPGPQRPEYLPLEMAIQRGIIDREDADQIEGVLTFFTVVWRLLPRRDRQTVIRGAASVWDASITSQPLTAFAASLPMLNATDNSGATVPAASSPPPSIGEPAPAGPSASMNGSRTAPGTLPPSSASVI